MASRCFCPSDIKDATRKGDCKRICGVVGECAEENGRVDALFVGIAHGGVEDVGNLICAVEMTEMDGRAEDRDHGFLDGSVVFW